MAKLTPEQQALNALAQDLPRSDLSVAAQLEYDRLKPAWERGEVAAAVPPRDLEPELQRGSEVVRHTVDISGATHTFTPSRRVLIWFAGSFGLLVVPVSVLAAFVPKALGISNTWARIAVIVIFDALVALLVVMVARSQVEISARKMTVRNGWRTRTVNISEIREITLEASSSYHNPDVWKPCVWLINGDHIWLPGFDGGEARRPPEPGAVAALDELRALIGLQPLSPS